jgi:myo-inositol-1(or 4)-monophosphatase
MRLKPFTAVPLSKGAAGDKTFPIDKKAEDIIINQFEAINEPLSIVSEEYGYREISGGGRKVLIDPIDGSKNAITGIPFYCSSVAVADDKNIGSISLAYVINLLTGDEFWAEIGKGAFFNGERIYTQTDTIFYLVAYEAQSPRRDIPLIIKLLSEARRTRCLGATALDLAHVAYGSVSVFVSPAPSRSFDFGAGWLLVKESGGVFTDLRGNSIEDIPLGLEKSTSILASGNKELHEKALKFLQSG